jgi:hypothetical protein
MTLLQQQAVRCGLDRTLTRRRAMNWNTALRSLLLIRFGQELGTDSATARAVADTIDLLAGMAAQGESRDTNPYLLGTWDSGQWLNGFDGVDVEGEYRIAFPMESGEWDVVETFTAESSDDANAYAEANYSDSEWFVLDASGKNINGGE